MQIWQQEKQAEKWESVQIQYNTHTHTQLNNVSPLFSVYLQYIIPFRYVN